MLLICIALRFFFFNDSTTTEIYALSLRDALPIYVTYNRAGNEAQRSSVGLGSLVDSVFSSYWHAFRDASELSASIIPVRSQKYIDRRFVPLRFSKSCLQPPLLPGFYPHSQGATWGPVHVGVRSQTWPRHNRDGTRLVGCCHLIGDLQGSGDYPQSPEQGEWMSLLQAFPITNRPPRHQIGRAHV